MAEEARLFRNMVGEDAELITWEFNNAGVGFGTAFPGVNQYGEDLLTFNGIGRGLVATDGLAGFELQTQDGGWQHAKATIDGRQVVVKGNTDKRYKGVRYGWRGFPKVTLFNSAGLPATPFMYPRPELKNK